MYLGSPNEHELVRLRFGLVLSYPVRTYLDVKLECLTSFFFSLPTETGGS